MVAIGCVLIGFGGGLFTPLAAGLAREFGAEGTGLAFGMCMVFVPVATVSSVGIARTQEVTGSHSPALITLALLVLAGGGLILLMREKQPDQLNPALSPAHCARRTAPETTVRHLAGDQSVRRLAGRRLCG